MTRLACLLIAIAACHDTRIETVTINPAPLIKPVLGSSREIGYLDEGVTAFRIRLVIKGSDKQPSFTVRLYSDDKVLGTYRLAPASYVLVVGDPMERNRLHAAEDNAPAPDTAAVELTIPTTTFEHRHGYALQLYGADDHLVAGYELETN